MRKLSLFSLVAVLGVLGCSSGPGAPPAISVSISPGTASVQAGSTAQFTATVTNDSANKGVNWSVTCPTAPCGTVSPTSTSSGSATTYTAPSNPPASNLTVTLTATSVADNTKSGTASITVPAITVSVSPATATVLAGATASVTATVANDPGNKGVTWTVSCSAAACGSVSPASTASGAPTTYTAPGPPASNLTVTVKATSVADTTKTASATITVPAITVSVAPATANVPVKGTQAFTATVGNDAGNKGVTWTLTQSGTACSPGCGTIAPAATPSGTPATYTAPATVPSPATVAITATSVADTSKSGTATATVLGITVSISPTSASVVVNATQQFIGTVSNDVTNSGVDWTLTQSGTPCSPTCGTVSAHTASGSPATYTAPGTVPSPATLTVTGTSTADPTKSASATVTVTAAPPISVSVAPTTASVAVNATASFTATVTNDPSISGVTWTLTQSGTPCSPTCGTVNPATTASGLATTYTAPASVPSPATVTLTAKSVADTTKSGSATITVTSAGANNGLLNGRYALLFNGFDSGGQMAIAGSFSANGAGSITGGVEDVNRASGVTTSLSFTGTYSIGSNNKGTMTLTSSQGSSTFHFVIDPTGSSAELIEFDDTTGTGTRGSGALQKQDPTAFSLAQTNGDFIMGLFGELPGIGRTGVAGRFNSNSTGSVSGAVMDISVPGASFSNLSWTGSVTVPSSTTGRGTLTTNVTIPAPGPGPTTLNFAYYIISTNKLFLVGTDLRSNTLPLLSGQVHHQKIPTGGFTNASLNGNIIFATEGVAGAGSIAIGQATLNGSLGTLTGILDQNEGGTIVLNSGFTGTYSVAANGRTTISFQINPTNIKPNVLYLRDTNKGFILEAGNGSDVNLGDIIPQAAGPFSAASLSGTFGVNTAPPAVSISQNDDGLSTLDGTSSFSMTIDISDTSGLLANQAFSGSYAVTSNGRGTISLATGQQLVFWIVSSNEFVCIKTMTSGDSNPVGLHFVKP